MAYGWGWSEKKFLNASPEFLFKTWLGKKNELERHERQEFERLRILGTWVLAPYSKNLTAKNLLPLPWDKVVDWKTENEDILKQCDEIIKNSGKTS